MVYQISSLQQGLASEGGRAGAASAWLPRAGSRSAGAGVTGPEARGVDGGCWPRYARVRPTDAAPENSHARGGRRWATLRPTETDMPPTALATNGHYAGGGSARAVRWSLPRGVRGRAGSR